MDAKPMKVGNWLYICISTDQHLLSCLATKTSTIFGIEKAFCFLVLSFFGYKMKLAHLLDLLKQLLRLCYILFFKVLKF